MEVCVQYRTKCFHKYCIKLPRSPRIKEWKQLWNSTSGVTFKSVNLCYSVTWILTVLSVKVKNCTTTRMFFSYRLVILHWMFADFHQIIYSCLSNLSVQKQCVLPFKKFFFKENPEKYFWRMSGNIINTSNKHTM